MKYLLSLALILACSLPAFAGHGFAVRQQVVVQRVRVQRVRVQRIRVQEVQQVHYVPAQQVRVEKVYVAPQQIQGDCHHDGQLQLRQQVNGCGALYR